MKRIITIEVDDANSKSLQNKPDKALKRIVRLVADQVAWGDESRPVQDKEGNEVGVWKMATS
jgi:hypothetical protein